MEFSSSTEFLLLAGRALLSPFSLSTKPLVLCGAGNWSLPQQPWGRRWLELVLMLAEVALWHCKSSSFIARVEINDGLKQQLCAQWAPEAPQGSGFILYFPACHSLLWGILGHLIYNTYIWYSWEAEVKQLKLENTRAAGCEWGAADGKVSPFFQRDPHCFAEETSWLCLWIWGFLEFKTLKCGCKWSNSCTSAAGYSRIPEIMFGLLKNTDFSIFF